MRLRDSCSCGATIDVEDEYMVASIKAAHQRFLDAHAACQAAPEPPRRYVDPPPALDVRVDGVANPALAQAAGRSAAAALDDETRVG